MGYPGANAERKFPNGRGARMGRRVAPQGVWGLVRGRLNWELFPSHQQMRIDQKEA
jgi:hypothetical protein